MYEESLRMPLLMSYPRRLEAGQVFTDLITNVDWAQTILDAAGVEHHPRMQGRSFWPDLLGAPEQPKAEGVYYRYWENDDPIHKAPAHYGYRTERYKLIYFYNDGLGLRGTGFYQFPPEWELYDLEADPLEVRNVYHDPAYAADPGSAQAGHVARDRNNSLTVRTPRSPSRAASKALRATKGKRCAPSS